MLNCPLNEDYWNKIKPRIATTVHAQCTLFYLFTCYLFVYFLCLFVCLLELEPKLYYSKYYPFQIFLPYDVLCNNICGAGAHILYSMGC